MDDNIGSLIDDMYEAQNIVDTEAEYCTLNPERREELERVSGSISKVVNVLYRLTAGTKITREDFVNENI